MKKFKAAAFIKTGSCLRYLINVCEGSAIGKAWPDQGQSQNDFVNSKMEKIHESANVLDNMQRVNDLLKEIGFENVRRNAQEHLKKILIPVALMIMNKDDGRGRLTAELAIQISENAREIRKGVIEAANAMELYDEFSSSESWPPEFKTELLWPIPWWVILAFATSFGSGIFIAQTPLYETITGLITPTLQVTSESTNESDFPNPQKQEQDHQ